MTTAKLFIDLDGVLADFDRGVERVTGKRPEQLKVGEMWWALARERRFFDTLEFMHDAELLWRFCKPFNPTILTGLPLGTWAPEQKRRWVARMLGGGRSGAVCSSTILPPRPRLPSSIGTASQATPPPFRPRRGAFGAAQTLTAGTPAAVKALALK